MNERLENAYRAELDAAAAASGDYQVAFHHLCRAHILCQRYALYHVYVHWRMLQLGLQIGDRREVFGQATRIVAAAIFSRIWIPLGNTGRADVGARLPMPVPEDLKEPLGIPRDA